MLRLLALALIALATPIAATAAEPNASTAAEPNASLESLLAADRDFSAEASKATDPVAALSAMFDDEIVIPFPGKGLLIGRSDATAVFRESPSYKDGKVRWTPIRGGVSADGTHGFTFGFLSLTGGDPARRERKYLSYWIKRPSGWRVAAYRQTVREPGAVSKDLLPPSLPKSAASAASAPPVPGLAASLAAAEKAFSDRAQIVGLKKAFHEYGRDDAMNMYTGSGFSLGLDAVVANFKEEGPAKIHWGTERSFVAPSGDLGVSIGTIKLNDPKETDTIPFFTIWRRDDPSKPWRYIAE